MTERELPDIVHSYIYQKGEQLATMKIVQLGMQEGGYLRIMALMVRLDIGAMEVPRWRCGWQWRIPATARHGAVGESRGSSTKSEILLQRSLPHEPSRGGCSKAVPWKTPTRELRRFKRSLRLVLCVPT